MAGTLGRLLLIKIGSAATGTALGGLRNVTFTFNTQPIDISTKDTAGWRELLEDGSLKSFSVSGDGYFTDSTSDETVLSSVRNGSIGLYTVVFPNGATYESNCLVTGYTRSGGHEGPVNFTISLESTGIPTYTAA
jgi:TP901-1 family phage major tail protein